MEFKMRILLIVYAVVSAVGPCLCKDMTEEMFDENVGGDLNVFVEFYTPWCPHCVNLEPTWRKLTNRWNVSPRESGALIGRVDCTEEKALCTKEKVKGYPTLKLYKAGETEGVDYEGPRELEALEEFLVKQLKLDPERLKKTKPTIVDNWLAMNDNSDEDDEDSDEQYSPPVPIKGLHILLDSNFETFLSTGMHFVEFYTERCELCKELEPTWLQLADSFEEDKAVRISKINCDANPEACKFFQVKAYPWLLWIVDGKPIDRYAGPRTHVEMKNYVDEISKGQRKTGWEIELDNALLTLSDHNFGRVVRQGVTFVKFLAPWCRRSRSLVPKWDELARKLLPNDVKVARVDCSQYETLCNKHGVDGYPTLLLFKEGLRLGEYEGERNLESMFNYAMSHVHERDEL